MSLVLFMFHKKEHVSLSFLPLNDDIDIDMYHIPDISQYYKKYCQYSYW